MGATKIDPLDAWTGPRRFDDYEVVRPLTSSSTDAASTTATTAATTTASTQAATSAAASTQAAQPSLRVIPIAAASSFDPNGDGSENEDQTGNAIDGDPTTLWQTESYNGVTDLAGMKGGVGLVLDLGTVESIRQVQIATPTPGWKVALYTSTAQESPTALDAWTPAAGARVTQATNRIRVAAGTKARYILLWITTLVPTGDGSTDAAGISEARVLGDAPSTP